MILRKFCLIQRYQDIWKILPFVIKAYGTKEGGIGLFRNQEKKFSNFFGNTSKWTSPEKKISYSDVIFLFLLWTVSQIKIKDKVLGKKVITLEKGFSHNRYPEPTLHILFYWFPMLLLIPKEAINDMVFRHRKMMQYQMWKYAGDIIYILLSFLWRKIKLKYGTMEILFSCRELRNLNLAFS